MCDQKTYFPILFPMQKLQSPYLLFLGDAPDQLAAKTATGIAQWRPDWCTGQLRLPDCNADLGLPEQSLAEAYTAGARTLIVGVANRGGTVSDLWRDTLLQAVGLGYDIASGLHKPLGDILGLAAANASALPVLPAASNASMAAPYRSSLAWS